MRNVITWDETIVAAAISLWAEGLSASQMAARLGVSRNALLGLAHRRRELFPARTTGRPINPRFVAWTDGDLTRAKELWDSGFNDAQIARAMGIKRDRVIMARRTRPEMFAPRERAAPVAKAEPAMKPSPRLAGLSGYLATETPPPAGGRFYTHAGRTIGDAASVPFKDLAAHQCSWSLTDFDDPASADMPCCGRMVGRWGDRFSAWCPEHAALAVRCA